MLVAVRMRQPDARRLNAAQLRRKLRAHLAEIDPAAQKACGECRVIVGEHAGLRDE